MSTIRLKLADREAKASGSALGDIENLLQQIIETHIELGIMVHDFEGTPEAKEGLMSRLNLLVDQTNSLSKNSQQLPQTVPLDVVEYIENGRNPDVYTREFVELLAKQNQYMNGKMLAMRKFRDVMAEQLKEAYPDLAATVDEVVSKTS